MESVVGAVVMKSGNFNRLETPGPHQACNGTASSVTEITLPNVT